jgi:hypothetical protein
MATPNETIDADDEDSLQSRLAALGAGIDENTSTLRAGLGLDTTQSAHDWAEKILAQQDPYATEEQTILGGMGQQAKDTVARLRAARERLAAKTVDKTDFWLAMAQGATAPNKGGKMGWAGNVAAAVRPALQAQHQFTDDQEAGLNDYDAEIEKAQGVDPNIRLKLLQEKRKAWEAERLRAATILGKNVPGAAGTGSGNKGEVKFGQGAAGETLDWATKNGAMFDRSARELQSAIDMIKKAEAEGKSVSGRDTWTSYLTLFPGGDKAEALANPLASDIRSRVLNSVQQTLRPTLGAQFTENEGKRVLDRAYDPLKPEKVNIARIQALLTQVKTQGANSKSIAQWFLDHNGDMTGYKMPSAEASEMEAQLMAAMDDAERSLGLTNQPDNLPPGTIRLDRKPKAKNPVPVAAPAGAPAPTTPMIDLSKPKAAPAAAPKKAEPVKKERGFFRQMMPFAEGGAVELADGGQADRVPAKLPNGDVVYFEPGTTEEQVRAWFDQQQHQENRKQMLTSLAASAAGGVGAGAAGYGAMRTGEGLLERMPGSPIRTTPGGRRTADEANRAGVDLSDSGARLRALQAKRIPAVGVDALPPEMRGLVNEAMRSGTPETAKLQATLKGRNTDAQANRLPDAYSNALASDEYTELNDRLTGERKTSADALYGQAFKDNPKIRADVVQAAINELNQSPAGKIALRDANANWKALVRAGKAKGNPVTPDATGMPRSYQLQYLDLINSALYKVGAGSMGLDKMDVSSLRDPLNASLDAATGGDKSSYKAARTDYAERSRGIEAMEHGRDEYLKMPPAEAKKYLDNLDFTQRDYLRSGVAEALIRELRAPGKRSNPAKTMLESSDRLDNMKLLLTPKDYNRLEATLQAAAEAWERGDEFSRKTESARGKAKGAPIPTAQKVLPTAKAGVGKAVRAVNPLSWLYHLSVPPTAAPGDKTRKFSSREAEDIVKLGSTRRAEELDKLARAAGRRGTRNRRAGIAGLTTGVGAAGALLYKNLKDNEAEREAEIAALEEEP